MRIVDAHIHVDHLEDPAGFVRKCEEESIGLFSNTVTPEGFLHVRGVLSDFGNVRVGLGLHPWWVDAERYLRQLDSFFGPLEGWRYVGEVGLDFSSRREGTKTEQLEVLQAILSECARQGGKVISLHCVHAYDQLFELLESTRVLDSCTCIIHWFSGTHDDLLKARELGCWFSVGARMLSSKRGRAYVAVIPADRLLLETDAPPINDGISGVYDLLVAAVGAERAALTAENGRILFNL